jgi:hypothetical protein
VLPASPAPSSPPSAAPAAAAPATGPFSIAAEAPDAFELYPLPSTAFVDAAGFLAQLGEGPLRQIPAAMKGMEKGEAGRILGIFPDGAWFSSGDKSYKWVRDRWAENALLRENEKLLDIAAWNERAVAAIAMPGNDMRFFLVGGKGGVALPGPSPAEKAPAPPSVPGDQEANGDVAAPDTDLCKVKMKPEGVSLAGLPTGHFYAAGYECQGVEIQPRHQTIVRLNSSPTVT